MLPLAPPAAAGKLQMSSNQSESVKSTSQLEIHLMATCSVDFDSETNFYANQKGAAAFSEGKLHASGFLKSVDTSKLQSGRMFHQNDTCIQQWAIKTEKEMVEGA